MPMIEIKNRFNGSVIYSCEALSTKECLELAVKDGANLSGANLSGAYLSGDIRIEKIPIQVSTGVYFVSIYDAHMQIGCKFFSLADWWSFDNRVIAEFDGKRALAFWKTWKAPLQSICEANGRG